MKKQLLFSLLIIGSFQAQASSDWQAFSVPTLWQQLKVSPSILLGDANGDFNWNIASDPSGLITPNVLSELSYDDLNIAKWQFETLSELPLSPTHSLISEFSIATGVIDEGVVRDSDYDQNNKGGEYSRSYSNPQGSKLLDYSFAAGFSQQLSHQWTIKGLLGYSFHEQSFNKKEGEQVLSADFRTPNVGKFGGLNSSYEANWEGPWLGAQLGWQDRHQGFNFRFEHHMTEYYAEADWNLRSDFAHPKSFDHVATGQGTIARFEYQRHLNRSLGFMVRYQHERWEAKNGIDTVYFANQTTATTRLNHSKWNQSALSVGFKYLTW